MCGQDAHAVMDSWTDLRRALGPISQMPPGWAGQGLCLQPQPQPLLAAGPQGRTGIQLQVSPPRTRAPSSTPRPLPQPLSWPGCVSRVWGALSRLGMCLPVLVPS